MMRSDVSVSVSLVVGSHWLKGPRNGARSKNNLSQVGGIFSHTGAASPWKDCVRKRLKISCVYQLTDYIDFYCLSGLTARPSIAIF